jgi:hypothetical protein
VTAQLPNTRPASIRASLAGPKHVTIQATTAGPAPTGVPTTGEESKQVDTTTKATVIDPAPIKMLSEGRMKRSVYMYTHLIIALTSLF